MSEKLENSTDMAIANKAITKCVYEVQSRIWKRQIPSDLWHYTGTAGFKGIVESNSFHFTNIRYLNDAREYLHAIDIIRNLTRNFRLKHKEPEAHAILDSLTRHIENVDEHFVPSTFVCCFSEVENDLSQWRAYGRDLGVSLGFNPIELVKSVNIDNKMSLIPCEYDIRKQHEMLGTVIGNLVIVFLKHGPKQTNDSNSAVSAEADSLVQLFLILASQMIATFKHNGFDKEHEWRLIIESPSEEEIHYMAKPTIITPYHPVAPPKEKKLPISKVWLGPGANASISANAAYWLMRKCGFGEVYPLHSEIPFRQGF